MFVPLHGMLMGVTPEQYKEIHRQKCRQKYVDERSAENSDFSYYMLTIDNFNGEDIMVDSLQNVRDVVLLLIYRIIFIIQYIRWVL